MLRSAITKAANKSNVARRAMSSVAPSNPMIPKQYNSNFVKEYLADEATYPILVIMGFAVSFATGASLYASLNYKNVKVRGEHKSAIIPTWKEASAPNTVVTEVATRNPISFMGHGARLKSLRQEGLGVDHEEWLARKQAEKEAL